MTSNESIRLCGLKGSRQSLFTAPNYLQIPFEATEAHRKHTHSEINFEYMPGCVCMCVHDYKSRKAYVQITNHSAFDKASHAIWNLLDKVVILS